MSETTEFLYAGDWRIVIASRDAAWGQRVLVEDAAGGMQVLEGITGRTLDVRGQGGNKWRLRVQHNDGSGWQNSWLLRAPLSTSGPAPTQVIATEDVTTEHSDRDFNDLVLRLEKLPETTELPITGDWRVVIQSRDAAWGQRVRVDTTGGAPQFLDGTPGGALVVHGGGQPWKLSVEHNDGLHGWQKSWLQPGPLSTNGATVTQVIGSEDVTSVFSSDRDFNDLVVRLEKVPEITELRVTGDWRVTVQSKDAGWAQRVRVEGALEGAMTLEGTAGRTLEVRGKKKQPWKLSIQHDDGSGFKDSWLKPGPLVETDGRKTQEIASEDVTTASSDRDFNDLVIRLEQMPEITELPITGDWLVVVHSRNAGFAQRVVVEGAAESKQQILEGTPGAKLEVHGKGDKAWKLRIQHDDGGGFQDSWLRPGPLSLSGDRLIRIVSSEDVTTAASDRDFNDLVVRLEQLTALDGMTELPIVGDWRIVVQGRHAAFPQRVLVRDTADDQGTLAGDVGQELDVYGRGQDPWKLRIQHRVGTDWQDSWLRLGARTVSDSSINLVVESEDVTTQASDRDFNDLVIRLEKLGMLDQPSLPLAVSRASLRPVPGGIFEVARGTCFMELTVRNVWSQRWPEGARVAVTERCWKRLAAAGVRIVDDWSASDREAVDQDVDEHGRVLVGPLQPLESRTVYLKVDVRNAAPRRHGVELQVWTPFAENPAYLNRGALAPMRVSLLGL